MTSINFESVDLDCPKTWKLISDGNTKGVFQLESRLGQMMAKKLKPSNIEELAALISIIRPGCLEAMRDGKSVTNHFIDKKNGQESIDYFHSSLEPILKTTYGEMVYQEQAMQIAQQIAGFNLQEADMLRKAIGKKNPEEMAKIKKIFTDKSKELGIVNDKESEEIFGWIEKSQRYSFNKSHAISYAMNAYVSAYAKCHHTNEFFVSYLRFAKDKVDPTREISELISNANELNIKVYRPDLRKLNPEFILDGDIVYFGLTNIKGLGDSVCEKLLNIIKDYGLPIEDFNLNRLLFIVLDNINSTAAKGLISSGSLDYLKTSRKKILFYLDIIQNLSKREKELIINKDIFGASLEEILSSILNDVNKKRKDVIQSLISAVKKPAYSLEDNYEWIASIEKQYLGASITCSVIDGRDLEAANSDCRSLSKSSVLPKNIILGAEISDINVVKTKSGANPGQEMAFLKLIDGTGSCDVIIFPKEFANYKEVLTKDNTVMFSIEQSKKKDTFFIKKCWQI